MAPPRVGIPVVVTQSGGSVTLDVQGLWGAGLTATVGRSTFTGNVGGSHVQADLIGTNSARQGNCTYTYTLELDAIIERGRPPGAARIPADDQPRPRLRGARHL